MPLNMDFSPPNSQLELAVIQRSEIAISHYLGEGQFSKVYCGNMANPQMPNREIQVAIKCRKSDDDEPVEKFIEEAQILRQFNHPHIVRVIGICQDDPLWIVMEYAPLGELRSYLIHNGDQISNTTLLLFCFQLCKALAYVEERNFVHRDIAARNVLVTSAECCKLSDFGLSRNLDENVYYKAQSGKMPIKWMAPESYNYKRFTSRSDVWMFGICVWEVFSHGAKPWGSMSNTEAIRRIEIEKERLEFPTRTPRPLIRLISDCWSYLPEHRPNFSSMKALLHDMVKGSRGRAHSLCNQEEDIRTNNTLPEPPPKPQFSALRSNGLLHHGGASTPSLNKVGLSTHVSRLQTSCSQNQLKNRCGSVDRVWGKDRSAALELVDMFDAVGSTNDIIDTRDILERQLKQSEADEQWLLNTESQMPVPAQSRHSRTVSSITAGRSSTASGSSRPESQDSTGSSEDQSSVNRCYLATLKVVKLVKTITSDLEADKITNSKDFVRQLGAALKRLFNAANENHEAGESLSQAQRTLVKDLERVNEVSTAYDAHRSTPLREHYLKEVLQPLHSLAVDCKIMYEAAAAEIAVVKAAESTSQFACTGTTSILNGNVH